MSLSKDIHVGQTHALDKLSSDEVARLLLEKIVSRRGTTAPSPHSEQNPKPEQEHAADIRDRHPPYPKDLGAVRGRKEPPGP